MPINFNKSWEERLKEVSPKEPLGVGKYTGKIVSASFGKLEAWNKTKYDGVAITVEIIAPEEFKGRMFTKNYILDSDYSYSESQTKQFVKLIAGFDLSYSNLEELAVIPVRLTSTEDNEKLVKVEIIEKNIQGKLQKIKNVEALTEQKDEVSDILNGLYEN